MVNDELLKGFYYDLWVSEAKHGNIFGRLGPNLTKTSLKSSTLASSLTSPTMIDVSKTFVVTTPSFAAARTSIAATKS